MPKKKVLTASQRAFKSKLDKISANLMTVTGIKNYSDLGKWLKKSDDRNAEMYFAQARYHGFLDFEAVIERCLESGLDLNEVFGNSKGHDYDALISKYDALEKQVKSLLNQNGILIDENKKVSESFRKISQSSQDLMLKYMEIVNKD